MVRVAGFLVCAALMGQVIDRTHAPAASAPRPYKLPAVFETRLPNGLDVILIDDARVPLVTARLLFPCGNRRDPKALPGVAAAVAELLTQGTKNHGFVQISEALDRLGGSLGASSGADYVAIDGSMEAGNARALIEIMAEVAKDAELSDLDLKVYRQNRRQTLARQRSQALFAANEEFRKALFGEHPYARVGPSTQALESMDRKALTDFRDAWMVPNNAYLIAIGKLPARAETMKAVSDRFGSWEKKAVPEVKGSPLPAPARRLILVDRPGATEAAVRMGKIGATQRDADYFAELVAAAIAGSEDVAFDDAGIVATALQARNEGVSDALQAAMERLDRMAAQPVTARELADAKSLIEGRFALRLEPQAGLADELMAEQTQRLPRNYLDTWMQRVEAVTAEEAQAAAKKYLSTQDMAIVVAGDAAKIGGALEKIGRFEAGKAGQ
jgi:zinc protease